MKITGNVYDLIPPQEMIQFMLNHSFFHKQVTQIPESVILSKEIDFDIMEKAINIEIERNDCLRLRFFKKKGVVKQYFVDKYTVSDIPVLNFKSEQEQVDYLTTDAHKPVKYLKDETFRIKFFKTYDNRFGIYICVHHLVMDNAACFVFFKDLLAIYDNLTEGKPMPKPLGKYEDIIVKELKYVSDKSNLEKDKEEYTEYITQNGEPLYLGVEGQKFLEKERKKNPNAKAPSLFDPIHDKAGFIKKYVPYELSQTTIKFMDDNGISGECLVQLAMRIYLSSMNNRYNDTYFITLCPRRRTLSEKRAGGTLTAPLPWRVVIEEELTFAQAIEKMADVQAWAFRHMNYPYLEYRKLQQELFNYKPAAGASTMMFSWLPAEENTMNGWEYEFVGYGLGRYIMALYTFAMKDVRSGCLKVTYQNRTKYISEDDINSFHRGFERVLELGVNNPKMTIGEILDKI